MEEEIRKVQTIRGDVGIQILSKLDFKGRNIA